MKPEAHALEIPAAPPACERCPAYNAGGLKRLGIDASGAQHVVALIGNPNTGKSTVFNALTGLRQHVGNWSGKTVSRAEGAFRLGDARYKLVDLPGCHSLLSSSHHEEIARDFLLFGRPDVTVVVVDATRLERNLILVLQTLEITDRVVVALNLMDEAKRHGIRIDVRGLERRLGVPVVPMTARRREGLPELLAAVEAVATGRRETRPVRIESGNGRLAAALRAVTEKVRATFPALPGARWVALRLLDGDHSLIQAIREGTLGDVEAMERRAMPSLNARELAEEA